MVNNAGQPPALRGVTLARNNARAGTGIGVGGIFSQSTNARFQGSIVAGEHDDDQHRAGAGHAAGELLAGDRGDRRGRQPRDADRLRARGPPEHRSAARGRARHHRRAARARDPGEQPRGRHRRVRRADARPARSLAAAGRDVRRGRLRGRHGGDDDDHLGPDRHGEHARRAVRVQRQPAGIAPVCRLAGPGQSNTFVACQKPDSHLYRAWPTVRTRSRCVTVRSPARRSRRARSRSTRRRRTRR